MYSIDERIIRYTVEVLGDLISIPTVNPPGERYREVSEYLEKRLEEMGLETRLIEIPETYLDQYYPYRPGHRGHPRYIVYARTGSGRPVIQFNGHYDVVPPGTGWTRDPFRPSIEGDRVYGRGATDMKGGIAAVLGVVKRLVETRERLDKTIELVFVPDEESGGVGTRYYVEKRFSVPDYVVIAEPTSRRRVMIGHKGLVRGVVRVYGTQVHGSVPWRGRNAFLDAARLALRLHEIYQEILRERSTSAPVEEPEARHPTINLGGFAESTSRKDNIVPGEFVFSFDRRVIPEEDVEKVSREVVELVERVSRELGVRTETEVLSAVPASLTPETSRLVHTAKACVSERTGESPWVGIGYGRDDGVYYRSIGIETITYGPGVEGTAHMPDEYTSIRDIESVMRVYECIIERL